MEALLCSAFDLLSSLEPLQVRKGLRHLEGLLAKLCLSNTHNNTVSSGENYGIINTPSSPSPEKPTDPAFLEFVKLQSGFEWNVTTRLLSCLERLSSRPGNDNQTNALLLSCLELIQGMLLIHRPSRHLFARDIHMRTLLDLLDVGTCPQVQCTTILTLVCAMLESPENTRTFEAQDGLATITYLFKRRDTDQEVKLKALELLYFYLMPEEEPQHPTHTHTSSANHSRTKSKSKSHSSSVNTTASSLPLSNNTSSSKTSASSGVYSRTRERHHGHGNGQSRIKLGRNRSVLTTEEKKNILKEYLPTADMLVSDLQLNLLFQA
ncbi:cell division control 14, SIN component [Ascobolus immersus RN42]|uniref:Cell division control 14, SIN component n=1 Tax=Ascobolus immersus RN42 TaxID=1160509 RepID=A0A3N4ILF0_ASCIM|nr:cell division control 14, SIN component [Ascobolus immersus RN42]